MKILIIDDEEDNRQVAALSMSLVGGFEVIEADGGMSGVALAESEKPDVILLDYVMPNMDGMQTLAALRANPQTANIPVIFLSTRSLQVRQDELMALGARGILQKPFNPESLPRLIREIAGI
ncbi:MAG TPA: response regulator [Candidatus Obscuribacterales bacterium]